MTSRLRSLSGKQKSYSKGQKAFLGRSHPLEVIPSEVVFKNIEVNQFYQITVEIRNLTNRATRIRFQKSSNPRFKVIYNMQPEIAPGLSTIAKIKYQCNELKNQTEILRIVNQDGYNLQLPVRVYRMESQIQFEPFINLGFIKLGKQHTENISFKNLGKAPGTIEFSHEHGNVLILQPKVLKVEPKQSAKLVVKYKGTEAGIFKGSIKLKSDSILVKQSIDINATIVEFARSVINSKGIQTSNFQFGNMLVGEQTKIKAFIVNNSPKPMNFKTFFRKGVLSSQQQFALVQTPSQIGAQQSQRVMFCTPESGFIPAFGEIELNLICKTRLTYKQKVFTNSYALTSEDSQGAINQKKNSNDFKPENTYDYSIMLGIENEEPIILNLRGTSLCPQIKISNNKFQFGDCQCHQSLQQTFTVQNKNPMKVSISFPKIPNFSVYPQQYTLETGQKKQFTMVFEPKSIGKVDTQQLLVINKIYQIELRCFGISTSAGSSKRLKKQIDNITKGQKADFKDKFIGQLNTRNKAFSMTERTVMTQAKHNQTEVMKMELTDSKQNKDRFNKYLTDKRSQRVSKQTDQVVKKRWSLYQTKLKDLGNSERFIQNLDQEGIPVNPPVDFEFESGMVNTKMREQFIPVPEAQEKLFVTRHVGPYEPPVSMAGTQKYFKDINTPPKKLLPESTQNYNHRRQICHELSSDQLEQIHVPNNLINFGEVYIKSKSIRYFWIKNATKKAISVRMATKDVQLDLTFKKPQILTPGQQTAFEVIFNKDTLGDYRGTMKYIINDIHDFEMTVTAKSVPVVIQVDNTTLKFAFEETSLAMETIQAITVYNPGNSNAFFKFSLGKDKYFVPQLLQSSLKPKQKILVPIKFTAPIPLADKNEYSYTQKLIMKVLDGSEVIVNCSCMLHNPKFTFKCPNMANTIVCIGNKLEQTLEIKNTSKFPAVFHIEGQIVHIQQKVRLNPDQIKKLKVTYQANEAGKFQGLINILPRGGKNKTLACNITSVKPQVKFSKQLIDFGVLVVSGIPGQQKFTLFNKTPIDIPLLIDLRPQSVRPDNPAHLQDLTLELLNEDAKLEVVTPPPKTDPAAFDYVKGGQNLVGLEVNQQQFDENDSDDGQQIIQKNPDQLKRFRLLLKSNKQYNFSMEFHPKQGKSYQVKIPFEIQNSITEVQSPLIICKAIKPQFLFEPTTIDFKKKIVTRPDRCYPKFITVKISNLDNEDIQWQVRDDEIKKDGIYVLQKCNGILKASQWLQFKVSFNPFAVGQYISKLPLYIKSSKLPNGMKSADIVLKGQAALPRMYFNKREIIMPVVPLNIETTSSFRIINDGYENVNLKCQFLDDVANLNPKVVFPEGSNIGITRQKLKVDIVWKYSKPMSFCLKLQFIDDLNRTFVIPVSGTTDNCIFTNYTYFLRNENRFRIQAKPHLQLIENQQQTTGTLVRKNSNRSLRSNVTGKSVLSYLGVSPISHSILSNTIDYINRYLNSNLLSHPISDFPGSFIENDGSQLFELLSFVSSKNPSYPWKYVPAQSDIQLERVKKIYNQYNELIKLLKTEGAQLNHMRPEYLMSFSDLNCYLANLPDEKSNVLMPSLFKISAGLYNYLSMDSWITLLYEILKLYVLGRVTLKNYKSHLGGPAEIPKYYLEGSNYTSTHENILFYWVQQAILETLLEERRMTNFDKDFKDGVAIAALIQKYAGISVLKRMKMACTTEDDCKENATVVCEALEQIGLLGHVTTKDIYNPLQRQMLLLILHLYVYLPFYSPKSEPVVFKCILGEQVVRSIELTNPSNKPVTYSTRYEGSEDFILMGENKFTIEAKGTYKYQVKFISRISASVKGNIMFINIKENTLTAAALVFELKSQIDGRNSDRIWNIAGVLYQQVQFNIEVSNKFLTAEMVDFAISFETQYIFENRPLAKNKSLAPPLPKNQQIQVVYGKQDNIKIRKNGTATLTLNYIPMSLYTTKTTILFVNSIVGEFQHQIIATAEPPAVQGEIRPPMALTVDQIVNWQYPIVPRNDLVTKAKKILQSLKKGKKGVQPNKQKQQSAKNLEQMICEKFKVQIPPNPYVSAKQQVMLNEKKLLQAKQNKKDNRTEIVGSDNKIPLTIVCKNPVYEFVAYVLVYNSSKTDVRRYKCTFTIQPKPLKAILEMSVPARGEVIQNLPVVNNTDKDWNIKISWQPDASKNGAYFSINSQYNSSFPVKRNSIGHFPITFRPKWAYNAGAKLIMNNPLTLDQFEYDIVGIGQQPLAQEHIQIKCEAKEVVKRQLIVKNPHVEKPITFKVQSDLLGWKGPAKLTIPSGGKQRYQFSVQPMLCGQYTGSITFSQQEGVQYVWYTVSIVTNYPQPYKSLDLISEIREKKVQDLTIPLEIIQTTNFQVIINGQGLTGDPTYNAEPGQLRKPYLLQFLPLQVGAEKGSVCFINPSVGETLYQFNMRCTAKPAVIINNLKSPLGVSTSVYADLVNPTPFKAHLRVINTNPQQFVIKSSSFRLAPLQKKSVEIEYIPASLDIVESANIKFVSKDIGDWQYQLSGSGQQPVPFPMYTVYNGLYQEHSDSLKFRNPFKYPIVVGVKLHSISQHNIFKLLNHGKDRFEIDGFGVLEIPFCFIPTSCKLYECKIIVMISEKIFWTYPIRGITEVNKGTIIAHLSTKCRLTTSESVQIMLEGVQNVSQNNLYTYQLANVPVHYQKICEKFLLVECHKDRLNHSKDSLEYQFIFKPMKPGKIMFDFLITRKEGSRWRYKICLEAAQPDPDDVIEIESNLLVTSTVTFKLTNSEKLQAPFKAKFTSDSAHQFSIEPKQGTLSSFGGKGTNFYISFTPVQYGKDKKGKLVIQTPQMYWSYLMKGSLPKYIPPSNANRSRVSSSKR